MPDEISNKPLAGKAALVTGGSRNIGRAIALALADAGAAVLVNGRSDRPAADAVAAEITGRGGHAEVHMADIGDETQAGALVARAKDAFGRLDFLVLNAAVRRQNPVTEITYREWRDVMCVALDGALLVSRAAVPHLIDSGGGRIIVLGGSPSHMGTSTLHWDSRPH